MSARLLIAPSLLLIAAACSSTPADTGASAGKTAAQAATQIDQGIAQLDSTVGALKQLVSTPGADLSTQYKDFAAHLGNLEATATDVSELATEIEQRSKDYFARWDAQIAALQNEDIKERSADRRADVSESFERLKAQYAEARDEFKPLLNDLRDLRSALGADLTMEGLKSVTGMVEDVDDEVGPVKESLQDLSATFRKLSTKLSQRGPAAEPASKG